MPSKVERFETSQFVERSPLIALGALGLLGAALVISPVFSRELLQQGIAVAPEETVSLEPVQPRNSSIGAIRIDALAQLPRNTWATFEVLVLDAEGNVLASVIKQAWSETGTWQEDGESGTWAEQDLSGRFDLRRAGLDGPLVVAVALLEYGNTSGQALAEPLVFRVRIWDGAIDTRFLWSGALGTLILSTLALVAVKNSGRQVMAERIHDSDVTARGTLGGPQTLVRVRVNVLADETSPATLNANLSIRDSYGEVVLRRQVPMKLSFKRKDNKVESATGNCTVDLILEPEDSYGFTVEITPDGPVDRTDFSVKQGVRTLGPTEITHIQTSAG